MLSVSSNNLRRGNVPFTELGTVSLGRKLHLNVLLHAQAYTASTAALAPLAATTELPSSSCSSSNPSSSSSAR